MLLVDDAHTPRKSKDYLFNGFSVETIVVVGIYNQQFNETILLMLFDFQGVDTVGKYGRLK